MCRSWTCSSGFFVLFYVRQNPTDISSSPETSDVAAGVVSRVACDPSRGPVHGGVVDPPPAGCSELTANRWPSRADSRAVAPLTCPSLLPWHSAGSHDPRKPRSGTLSLSCEPGAGASKLHDFSPRRLPTSFCPPSIQLASYNALYRPQYAFPPHASIRSSSSIRPTPRSLRFPPPAALGSPALSCHPPDSPNASFWRTSWWPGRGRPQDSINGRLCEFPSCPFAIMHPPWRASSSPSGSSPARLATTSPGARVRTINSPGGGAASRAFLAFTSPTMHAVPRWHGSSPS